MVRFFYADDVGADAAQFFFQFFVAAVQMVDPVDDGFTFGNEAGQNQGKRSSQVAMTWAPYSFLTPRTIAEAWP